MLCPRHWSRLPLVSSFVSGLGCCVRLPSLVLLLPPNLSPILAGVLRPPPWSRLSLVSGLVGLVSQLVSGLAMLLSVVWDAVSDSLVLSCSCLPTCLPSGLGCCALLSLVLSPNKSPVWDAVSASLVLSCSCLPSCLPASWPPVW